MIPSIVLKMTDTLPAIQSLECDPKLNAPQFLRDAASAAAASCPALGGLLAMGALETDLQWLLKNPALPDLANPGENATADPKTYSSASGHPPTERNSEPAPSPHGHASKLYRIYHRIRQA